MKELSQFAKNATKKNPISLPWSNLFKSLPRKCLTYSYSLKEAPQSMEDPFLVSKRNFKEKGKLNVKNVGPRLN